METSLLFDAPIELQSRERTPEGYLRATAVLTKVGVMDYDSAEIGLEGPSRQVGVMRPYDVVFHETTMASASMKPVTLGHPQDFVNVKNHKRHSVGHLGETAFALDNEKLAIPILLTDERAIKQVEGGKDDVSVGYHYAGLAEDVGEYGGKPHQHAFQGHMVINHLAIAPRNRSGRGGKEVRILDTNETVTKEDVRTLIDEALEAALPKAKEGEAQPTLTDEQMQTLTSSIEGKLEALVKAPESETDEDESKAEDDQDEQPDAEEVQKQILDQANERASLIVLCQPFLKDDQDASTMSNSDMLVAAIGDTVKDAKDKSDDYLRGVLDQEAARRKKAKESRKKAKDTVPDKLLAHSVPVSAQEVVSALEVVNG